LIARIKEVRFAATRLHSGYDERDVDKFLDAVVANLASSATPLTPAQIRDKVFRRTRVKNGYLIEDVDDFRGLLADAVEHLR